MRTIKKEFCGVKLTVLEHRSLEIYLTKQDFADILEAVSLHVDLAPGLYEGVCHVIWNRCCHVIWNRCVKVARF